MIQNLSSSVITLVNKFEHFFCNTKITSKSRFSSAHRSQGWFRLVSGTSEFFLVVKLRKWLHFGYFRSTYMAIGFLTLGILTFGCLNFELHKYIHQSWFRVMKNNYAVKSYDLACIEWDSEKIGFHRSFSNICQRISMKPQLSRCTWFLIPKYIIFWTFCS